MSRTIQCLSLILASLTRDPQPYSLTLWRPTRMYISSSDGALSFISSPQPCILRIFPLLLPLFRALRRAVPPLNAVLILDPLAINRYHGYRPRPLQKPFSLVAKSLSSILQDLPPYQKTFTIAKKRPRPVPQNRNFIQICVSGCLPKRSCPAHTRSPAGFGTT